MELRYLLKSIVLPPLAQLCLLLFAWLVYRKYPKLAKAGFLLAFLSLWILAMPVTVNLLTLYLEQDSALRPEQLTTIGADVIVILTGAQNENAPEYGEPVSHNEPLSRVRYGAFIHKRTGLPILLSGGSVSGNEKRSLAETMGADLANGFGIKANWLETKSRTTLENATNSYTILAVENKTSIILVTNALHMMRAKWSFEQAGFKVHAAPTGFTDRRPKTILSFLPNANSLNLSSQVIHEWLGYWFYRARTSLRLNR